MKHSSSPNPHLRSQPPLISHFQKQRFKTSTKPWNSQLSVRRRIVLSSTLRRDVRVIGTKERRRIASRRRVGVGGRSVAHSKLSWLGWVAGLIKCHWIVYRWSFGRRNDKPRVAASECKAISCVDGCPIHPADQVACFQVWRGTELLSIRFKAACDLVLRCEDHLQSSSIRSFGVCAIFGSLEYGT